MGYLAWNLFLAQGLPLFVFGAVNHSKTLEVIGGVLLVLLLWTGYPAYRRW
jgi:hypothetical protein